jgi:tRNA (cmo5U34)-methyltransferase
MTQKLPEPARWKEADSQEFIDYGRYYVPERELQIQILTALIPQAAEGSRLIDLCCGEGLICRALLERFSGCNVHGYDGSERMLERSAAELASFEPRFHTRLFDLTDNEWRAFDEAPHAFVSSLAIHHLDGVQKRQLFTDLHQALRPGGALVIADLVEPASELARKVAADQWDEAVRQRALDLDGRLEAFHHFQEIGWNNYHSIEPDPIDKPSPLLDQLRWMEAAGFTGVDAHWMRAGHVIFSGYKASS